MNLHRNAEEYTHRATINYILLDPVNMHFTDKNYFHFKSFLQLAELFKKNKLKNSERWRKPQGFIRTLSNFSFIYFIVFYHFFSRNVQQQSPPRSVVSPML